MSAQPAKKHTILDSTFPVLVPKSDALLLDDAAFSKHIQSVFPRIKGGLDESVVKLNLDDGKSEGTEDDSFTLVTNPDTPMVGKPFMDALLGKDFKRTAPQPGMRRGNMTFTANGGVAYLSTNNHLLDLFYKLQNSISGPRLRELLENSWKDSPINTLKIIWNARSIHLGKGDKESFYRCLGWLKAGHPETFLKNLPWVCRPIIEKKVGKNEKDDDEDLVIIEKSTIKSPQNHDVLNGVAHGYWKDLLNILLLDTQTTLCPLTDPRISLNIDNKSLNKKKDKLAAQTTPGAAAAKTVEEERAKAKKIKHEKEAKRHRLFLERFKDPSYAALHNTIARIFAAQLKKDLTLIQSKSPDLRGLSLAGKWAPSLEGFHDQYTFIASSIAELLYPPSNFPDAPQDGTISARTAYLKKARAKYQQATLSPLRKALSVVERTISSRLHPFPSPDHPLNYSTVPSVAMNNYRNLFATKDTEGYSQYLTRVSTGKSKISGATLQPGLLVKQSRQRGSLSGEFHGPRRKKAKVAKPLSKEARAKLKAIEDQASDLQWRSLVQRVKDSGKLESSIAVCDVSGSMYSPVFADQTTPLDHAIGLSLIISEVGSPPFQGAFISFSETPIVHQIDISSNSSFNANVQTIVSSTMGYNTNFIAVFLDLILPMALESKLKPEDMVKRVFVFSDMHFDEAEQNFGTKWRTAFQMCTREFNKYGYQLPELVFWNLAAGRSGAYGGGTQPKPVTDDVPGAALVSGYGQGMIKVFLEEGSFDVPEPEIEKVDDDVTIPVDQRDGPATAERVDTRSNPVDTMMRALSHKAYSMLEVVD